MSQVKVVAHCFTFNLGGIEMDKTEKGCRKLLVMLKDDNLLWRMAEMQVMERHPKLQKLVELEYERLRKEAKQALVRIVPD